LVARITINFQQLEPITKPGSDTKVVARDVSSSLAEEEDIYLLRATEKLARWVYSIQTEANVSESDELLSWALANVLRRESIRKHEVGDEVHQWYHIIRKGCSGFIEDHDPKMISLGILRKLSRNPEAYNYHLTSCETLAGKRAVFVTSSGHIGSGSQLLICGDRVALLKGIPFL
jgi:hypothetical protein